MCPSQTVLAWHKVRAVKHARAPLAELRGQHVGSGCMSDRELYGINCCKAHLVCLRQREGWQQFFTDSRCAIASAGGVAFLHNHALHPNMPSACSPVYNYARAPQCVQACTAYLYHSGIFSCVSFPSKYMRSILETHYDGSACMSNVAVSCMWFQKPNAEVSSFRRMKPPHLSISIPFYTL